MEIPMTQDNIGTITEQFSQGPTNTPHPGYGKEELEQKRKEREEQLDNMLPFMRKEEEYNRIQMSLTEMDVLMGRLSAKQVPGLLGLELLERETRAMSFLADWTKGQQDAIQQRKMQEQMVEQEKKAKEWWDSLTSEAQEQYVEETNKIMVEKGLSDAYNGLTEGQRINIIMQSVNAKSASVVQPKPAIVDAIYYDSNTPENVGKIAAFSRGEEYSAKWETKVDNELGEFSIDVPVSSGGQRTLYMKPGMYIVKDSTGQLSTMTAEEYSNI